MVTQLLTSFLNRTSVSQTNSGQSNFFITGSGSAARRTELESYDCVSTLFAVVNSLASDVAAVDWKLYRKSPDQRRTFGPMETPRQEVVKHAALSLWNKPNAHYTRQEFVESFQQHVDLTGESEWFVGRFEGLTFPTELWVVRPDRMEPMTDREQFLLGWIYTDPDGQKVPLEPEEVIQIRIPDPTNPYRGKGPVASMLVDLDAAEMAAVWNANFFRNSAVPGGVVQVPNTMTEGAFKRLQQQFREQYRGVTNAHRTAILEEGANWVSTSYSMKDMEFSALRGMSRDIILEGFRFPEFYLGRWKEANRATALAAKALYNTNLIKPRLERIKQALNNDFLPMFGSTGENVEFDYVLEEPEDPDEVNASRNSRVTAFVDLLSAGVDPEDAAMFCELPPMRMKEVDSVPAGSDSVA